MPRPLVSGEIMGIGNEGELRLGSMKRRINQAQARDGGPPLRLPTTACPCAKAVGPPKVSASAATTGSGSLPRRFLSVALDKVKIRKEL